MSSRRGHNAVKGKKGFQPTHNDVLAELNRGEAAVVSYLLRWRTIRATSIMLTLLVIHVLFAAASVTNNDSWAYAATIPFSLFGMGIFTFGVARQARDADVAKATGASVSYVGNLLQIVGILVFLAAVIGPLYVL